MRFEWDPKKAEENYRKHFIRFSEVEPVFDDEHAIEFLDESSEEERYLGIGMDGFGRVLVVVYTWRGENVRLISARRATRSEERQYAKGQR
ncbi:MAG TPA: BrnT family toxin [Thermoanaerobaculia bacterium]|nr:BrnT family toxin [Thermoanaerobaculia bacterium]